MQTFLFLSGIIGEGTFLLSPLPRNVHFDAKAMWDTPDM